MKGDAVRRQHLRKAVSGEKGVFAFAQGRKRIEPLQLRIHKAGMTHHHASVAQAVEKARKQLGEIRIIMELISPGEGRVGA